MINFGPVVFSARDPGAVNCFIPIAIYLKRKGIKFYFHCFGVAAGSIGKTLDQLLKINEIPSLILTTTRQQVEIYAHEFPMLKSSHLIPVGQPASVVESLTLVARSRSQDEFRFIYRPHPREKNELFRHPSLDKFKLPKNLLIIAFNKIEWKLIDLSSREISAASDLITTIFSTVAQETALSGVGKKANSTGWLTMHVLLPGTPSWFRKPDNLLIVALGATAVAYHRSEIPMTPKVYQWLKWVTINS